MNNQQREIAIFWDYENVPLPDTCTIGVAAKAIVDAVSSRGRIVDRRLYYDFDSPQKRKFSPRDSFRFRKCPLESNSTLLHESTSIIPPPFSHIISHSYILRNSWTLLALTWSIHRRATKKKRWIKSSLQMS